MKNYLRIFLVCVAAGFLGLSCDQAIHSKLVWSGVGAGLTGDISPDGSFFSDVNWNTGDLMLINPETDEVLDLTGEGYDTGYAWMSSFSNDGKHIAYEWYSYETGTHELRIYSFEDSIFRTLIPAHEDILYLEPLDWFQNDDYILIAKQVENENWEFGKVSAEEGRYEKIINLNWNAPGGMHPFAYPHADLSPDNQYIGFDYYAESSGSNDLFLVSVETGTQSILLEGKGEDRFLAWRKDGQEVLFYSDRSGVPSLWTLRVKDGKPKGEPELIMENVPGMSPIGYSDKGFAYSIRSGDLNTYIAEIDTTTGEIISGPVAVDSNCYCRNNVGDWSKDGRSLSFIRFNDLPAARESLVIKTLENKEERELLFPWDFHNKTGTVSWVLDDIVLVDGNSPGYSGIHRFNLSTGEISIPADFGEKGFFQRFETNSDGSELFVEIRFGNPGIVKFDVNTGEGITVFEGAVVPTSLAVSPDDEKLAFLQRDAASGDMKLKIYNLITQEIHEMSIQQKGRLTNPVAWTADGERVLVGVNLPDNKAGLWSVDVSQKTDVVFIGLTEAVYSTLVTSPDGVHVAFQSGSQSGNYYFLEGF